MTDSLSDRLDAMETGQARSIGQVLSMFERRGEILAGLDRRVTRLESWRELVTLPDEMGRRRRVTDRESPDG
jgi:hypothetical protein